ncbi:diaminopimelate epimerase [Acidobacteriota bacterium]
MPSTERNTFSKYSACGNDYIVVEPERLSFPLNEGSIRILCDRHKGIGSDGILARKESVKATYGLRVFNPDGGEAEFSGNGVRIFARFARDRLGEKRRSFTIETQAGITALTVQESSDPACRVEAVVTGAGPLDLESAKTAIAIPEVGEITGYRVSVGNPHFVVFTDEIDVRRLHAIGGTLQEHPAFPEGVNVELVTPKEGDKLYIGIWERGVGETLASGSCACAAFLASRALGHIGGGARIIMKGGEFWLETGQNASLKISGPVTEIMNGTIGSDLVSLICE